MSDKEILYELKNGCRILGEKYRNIIHNEFGNHKDCYGCHVWNGVVVNGNDVENYKRK